MASVLSLRLHPPPPPPTPLYPGFQIPAKLSLTSFQVRKTLLKNSPIRASSSPSNWEREEIRWLREEQRWIREEQRWIRQESRWNLERETLLREISDLKLQIQALERQNSTQGASMSETISNIVSRLQVLKDSESNLNQIAEISSGPIPMLLESESEEVKEMLVKEVRILSSSEEEKKKEDVIVKRTSLRKGSEGEDVRAMQEALQKLGFYSGEEDMEYSSFSVGTERAVKTWQASLGALEDGIMTAKLLERLFMEQGIAGAGLKVNADNKGNSVTVPEKESANGAAVASVTEVSEIKQTVVKESGITEVEVSQNRVFLLGENRWEEPSRLLDRNKQVSGSKTRDTTTKCIACRGEGRLFCAECDGTGEPNIEEQFLEWVDEGTKCPYCEGVGYSVCDVCEGKATIF